MKKITRRIACGALSLMMLSSLALEHNVRLNAENGAATGTGAAQTMSASFKNVTGQYDTSKIMQENFNSSVLNAGEVAPTYETRTVIVTLDGAPIADLTEESVSDFMYSFTGNLAAAEIKAEQQSFLNKLSKMGIEYTYKGAYDTVLNGVAIEINTKHVSTIKSIPGVLGAYITTAYAEPKTADIDTSGVTTNETDVYATGIYDSSEFTSLYGQGSVVAVLDTGLDYTHPAFQGFASENVAIAWDEAYVKSVFDNRDFQLSAETRYQTKGKLSSKDVYVSDKVPFAFDYADDDADVYPSYSNHGTHVAGIIGGYDTNGYTDKDGNPISETFKGVVPDCQLVICKVFTDDLDDKDLGGAVSEDIVAALDDCVKLGVDVINMSLGTSCGFTTTNDGDDEGEMLSSVYNRIQEAGISLICAASNDYSAGYGGVYGTNLATNPDSSTIGSPATFSASLAVASINGQKAGYMVGNTGLGDKQSFVFFEESRDGDGNPYDFVGSMTAAHNKDTFEYVVVGGKGLASDYTLIKKLFVDGKGNSLNRIALIERGSSTFQEKVEVAMKMGAIGVIVYNNVSGVIRMNLGEIDNPVPAVSINMNAGKQLVDTAMNYTAQELAAGKEKRVGTLTLSKDYVAGPFMSEFSSWGPTHDLKLKPEITAHGGEITSAVPGGYGEQSGTSMATPNMAGFMAIVRQYIKQELGLTNPVEINRLAMQLTMSTAGMVYDQDGLLYSPRKQGAGVAKLENVVGGTGAYLWTDVEENDYRPKLELGDDPDKTGVYEMSFKLTNFSQNDLSFKVNHAAMTETLASDKMTVSEQAHMFKDSTTTWKVNGKTLAGSEITAEAGETLDIEVVLKLDKTALDYLNAANKDGELYFANGMYVEGFLQLASQTEEQCNLNIPFLGFYGDWESAPMLDYSAFEVAENAQDASVLDEDKIKASVWETLPYNTYYNETYIVPMGGYVYLVADGEDPVYVNEEYCSVSRYNEYYGEGNNSNYLSSTAIKAVYAGLLRNARLVKYTMYNVETGELILEDKIYRVGKAYAGGGSGVPANVEINLNPELEGLAANGKYEMRFEFFQEIEGDEDSMVAREEDTYSFSFTVDYEAPVLQDARVRYYNYKVDGEQKQRIYLDLDIYDNHYAQAALLCYPSVGSDGTVNLLLATDYPTPIRKPNKNGTTTVSIEVTDFYEKYGNQLYLQIDDYAINSCLYQIDINKANSTVLPENNQFALAEGEDKLTLDIYQEHKVNLTFAESYKGNADLSNFTWTSLNPSVVTVKDGVIAGLKAGKAKVVVTNAKGGTKTIDVTVTDKVSGDLPSVPTISFGTIKTYLESLTKAEGTVVVNSGQTFELTVEKDPWYHPMSNLRLIWQSSNESVAKVDNGMVTTLKKGTAIITAKVERKDSNGNWGSTLYSTSVTLKVFNEFTASNYMLTDYNGLGYNAWICEACGEAWVVDELVKKDGNANRCPECFAACTASTDVLKIPSDLNVMYIAEEAFKDNNNIKKIIIPASVIDIQARAFINCTALEEVYFVSLNHREDGQGNIIHPNVDWADVALIYEQAFYNCPNLKKVDFSNAKTVTLAAEVFAECPSLCEVVDMPSIGTMNRRAFANTALTEVDLTGLHMSGSYVFAGCNKITSIKTGKFTAIGDYMFANCTSLQGTLVLNTPKIGTGAFSGCSNLSGVTFDSKGEKFNFDIGARAFANCGKKVGEFTVNFGNENIRTIGDRAFAGSMIQTLDFSAISGLQILGANVFADTLIKEIKIGDKTNLESLQLLGAPFKGYEVTLSSACTKYVAEKGAIYDRAKTKLLYVNESAAGTNGVFTLPSSVKEIAAYAFANNKNITKVVLHDGLETLGEYAFASAAVQVVEWSKLGSQITEIPEGAFKGSMVKSIVLPDSVTHVGDFAFANSALQSFTADGLQSLGNNVFESCNALQEIALCDGIKTMGDRVFKDCESLHTVVMPSVEKLGAHTFEGAEALKKVTFGAQATTVGTYTFVSLTRVANAYYYDYVGVAVEEVIFLGNEITTIGEGAFYGCKSLKTIELPASVTSVADYAFMESGVAEINLENLVEIGAYAFYNSKVETLKLDNAKTLGTFAFGAQGEGTQDVQTAYTSVSMPIVENIGNFAFLNSGLTKVTLPASLKTLGYGAFASSAALTEIKVDSKNEQFFLEDGVLYRWLNKSAGECELCFYPATRLGDGEKNARAYSIKEGALSLQAYAFYGLNKDVLNKVVLPYSVNTIGDSAFFASGVTEYTFESLQAPVLEAVYREEIRAQIQTDATSPYYRGYYYSNFQSYLFNYTNYVGEKSTLVMNYPENGTGYNNYIYQMYFGVRNTMGIVVDDNTRECISTIEALYANIDKIKAWKNVTATDALIAEITATSEQVKTARVYYNNAVASAAQSQFITAELGEMLSVIESELRGVKQHFNIPIKAQELKVSGNSQHKSTYVEGEVFDATGLIAIIVYDDYSTEEIDVSKLTAGASAINPLTKNSKQVEFTYNGLKLRVAVSVTAAEVQQPDNSASDSSVENKGCGSALTSVAFVTILAAAGLVILKKKEN